MKMSNRYFLELSYDGTRYAGWQRQPNVTTIQGCIEESLKIILKEETPIYGCGRTDRGVHARNYIAHLDLPSDTKLTTKDILYKLNRILNKDIALHRLISVAKDAHARYDAIARTYIYNIHVNKSPFLGLYSTFIKDGNKINFSHLQEVADRIKRNTDFTSFCKLHGSDTSNICKIMESTWSCDEETGALSYRISANRFLRGMVRLIVGSSLNVASGKLSLLELDGHIAEGTRSPLMKSAPPQGLSLVKVSYPFI